MNQLVLNSSTIGIVISLIGYGIGVGVKRKFKFSILNPLLIAIVLVISVLLFLEIEYENYHMSAQYLNYLLTPATVSLSIPLYQQLRLLKENGVAIFAGILAGVVSGLGSVHMLSIWFELTHEQYVTLLPKSITTAIGMGVSEEMGGYASITVAVIIMTGVLGNVCAESICKLAKITHPVAKGVVLGTSSHAIGTARAMEMGEVEGAMSSLALVISGILTLVGISIFINLM